MDREVIHTLLGLFQRGVAEDAVRSSASTIPFTFSSAVDRHCYRSAPGCYAIHSLGFVNIATSGKIHHGIHSLARGPYQFFHFFFDGRSDRQLPILALTFTKLHWRNHRLRFRMINVGRDNRTSGSNFITDKFRSDIFRQTCAKAHSGCWWRKTSLRMRSRPIFSRMAMNSISGVMIPLRA